MKSIGIVICNYNKKDYILQCIQSILESKFRDFDIYVVDNASTDDSVSLIKKNYSDKVELIVNKENLGGSGGFNTGLRRALEKNYKYLMCIDNDVLLDENAIGESYNFLETHSAVGIVGSKVYHMDNPDYIQEFGVKIDFEHFCVEANYWNHIEDGTMPEVVYCDCVAACSLMIRASVIKKIGIMPEENFLYWDDTEWCYRCGQAGYKVASYGKSQVLHAMGAKKEVENTFPTYYAWRNWIAFFIKYTPVDKISKMADTFLNSIFNIIYEGFYKGERNRMKTVMYAYDDALHQIVGKASEDKIFPLDSSDYKLTNLLKGKKKVYIQGASYEIYKEDLAAKIKNINADLEMITDPNNDYDISFTFCDDIFKIRDFSLSTIYIDIFDNILATEEDISKVLNYSYSRESFIFSHKPLFIHMIKEIRNI